MALLFSEPLVRSFRASRLSCAYWFCWLLVFAAVILPFFLAFSSQGFWLRLSQYEEQPTVLYRHEVAVFAYSETQGSLVFSSMSYLNNLYFDRLAPITIQSMALDSNYDGKPDLYDFNFTLTTAPDKLRSIKVLTFFDYRMRGRVRFDMVTMAFADVDMPSGGAFVYIDGELALRQKQAVGSGSQVRTVYNQTFYDQDATSQTYLPTVLSAFNDRNETTEFSLFHKPLVTSASGGNTVKVHMKVRIPAHQVVLYRPGFLELMKFAWIQYICIFIPVAFVIYSFARFVYGNQIIETSVTDEVKGNRRLATS